MVRNDTFEERYDSWEALKWFLRECDHKYGEYSEVTFSFTNLPSYCNITLSEGDDGSVLIDSEYYNNLCLDGKITDIAKKLTRFEMGPELILTSERYAIPFKDKSCAELRLHFDEDRGFEMSLRVYPEVYIIDIEKVADIEYSRGAVHEIGEDYERDDYLELKLMEFQGNTWREINLELP